MFSAESLTEIVSFDGIDDGLSGVDLEKFSGALQWKRFARAASSLRLPDSLAIASFCRETVEIVLVKPGIARHDEKNPSK